MNVRQSVARLPESLAGLIAASAAVRPQIERGEPLNRIVGSAEWADRWQSGAEPKTVGLLATIVRDFPGEVVEPPAAVTTNVEDSYAEGWKDFGTVDGTFYAAPLDANVKSFVWYSPSMFEEAGYDLVGA